MPPRQTARHQRERQTRWGILTTRQLTRPARLATLALAASAAVSIGSGAAAPAGPEADQSSYYRPKLATPELVAPFLKHLEPGSDSFPEEREAAEIAARLTELGDRLKASPDRATSVADWFLAPGFRGGRLTTPPSRSSPTSTTTATRTWCSRRERSPCCS